MKRRAHFIWTHDRKIDHEAYFRLVSREPIRREGDVNQWVCFRKSFEIGPDVSTASIKIACDGRYQLFVNGERAARGPARASPHFMRYDVVDINQFVRHGPNVLAILVHSPGVDLAWYETTRGAWQPVFGDGGLYVEFDAGDPDNQTLIDSDESWRVMEARAWRRDTPRSGWGQDFIEDFDANLFASDWIDPSFDDSAWSCAKILVSKGSAGDEATGRGRHEPFPCLLPREIPQMSEGLARPERIVWARGVAPRPDLPLDQQLYQEELCDAPPEMFSSLETLVRGDEVAATMKTANGADASIMLAFTPYVTGCPFIEIEAAGGEIIDVAAAEAIPGEFSGDTSIPRGLKRPDFLTGAHLFRYRARTGRQTFEKFEWTSVRALQVTVRNAPQGVTIRRVGVRTINYPAAFLGAFACSDPFLTDLWRVGRHTALQCMHDSFEDCPGREKRQWVGDGVIHLDIAEAAFGPSAYPLGRQFLIHASESQRPDGLIQMYAPGDHRENGVIIPDFTLHWIRGVANYYLSTGGVEFAERLFPSVEKSLQWFSRHRDAHGLLADIPFWHFIEWAHIDRAGESAAINALYAQALKSAAELAEAIGYGRAAVRYRSMADAVAAALNERHWSATRGVYVDSVDPETGAQGGRVSQQANALMIAFEIAPRERWRQIISTITDEAVLRFTAAPPIFVAAPPFDENRHVVRANTFFCHFLYEALAKAGRFDLAIRHMRNFYAPMLDTGSTTLWESFEPSASLCHVFSATPVCQLSRHILGVRRKSVGFSAVEIAPQLCGLGRAEGVYPTPHGDINVRWRRAREECIIEVDAPQSVTIDIVAPDGLARGGCVEKVAQGQRSIGARFR